MSSEMYELMRTNPKFQELVRRRRRFAWTLTSIVLALFYGFVLVVAFLPKKLGLPLVEGSKWTIGVTVELFMFIVFWLLTGLYVRKANNEFDGMTQDLIKDASEEKK